MGFLVTNLWQSEIPHEALEWRRSLGFPLVGTHPAMRIAPIIVLRNQEACRELRFDEPSSSPARDAHEPVMRGVTPSRRELRG